MPLSLLLFSALGLAAPALAATITVDTLSGQAGGNASDCTLRDAITAANTNQAVDGCPAGAVGADLIVFAAGLGGLTITLTEQDNFWYGPNALPPIYSQVTIDGGTSGITIKRAPAAPKMRFFYVAGLLHPVPVGPKTNPPSPGTLTLRRLTLEGGLARGGNTLHEGGGGAGLGGAIYNQGTLTLNQMLATGNVAEGGSSSGSYSSSAGGGGLGGDGGISAGGGFRYAGNTISAEGGDFLGGEGGHYGSKDPKEPGGSGGVSSIGGDGADGKTGGGAGGGFRESSDGGGAATFSGGGSGAFGGGGGLVGGSGGVGGGAAGADKDIQGFGGFGGGGGEGIGGGGFGGGGGGSLRGNHGGFGGGGGGNSSSVDGGDPVYTGGDFAGDGGVLGYSGGGGGAGLGGVVFNHFGSVLVVNSTLSGNAAQGGSSNGTGSVGGGGAGLGGALFNLNGTLTVENSTLASNRATGGQGGDPGDGDEGEPGQGRGGALFNHFQDDGVGNDLTVTAVAAATFTLRNSILANSVDALEDCFNNDAASSVTLQGANLIETNAAAANACGTPTISSDPQLGSLLDNLGPTRTLAFLIASPARDAAIGCAPSLVDQRGVARPQGSACDLGAYEEASAVDLGDAPDPPYPTLSANKGPRHYPSPLHLGDCVDTESVGQQSPNALGDDAHIGIVLGTCAVEGDDEDGVVFISNLAPDTLAQVSVVATTTGLLDAWLDFNRNGAWSAEEQIFTSEPLAAGANVLNFAVPASASLGATFARFRVSSAGGLKIDGIAIDGEVEDYAVTIVNAPPAVTFEDGFESTK